MGTISLVIGITLVVCIVIGTPICMALGTTAVIGILLFMKNSNLSQLVNTAYSQGTSMNQLVAPLFVLMAEFLAEGGIAADIYSFLSNRLKKFHAGLAIAATLTSTVFAALCGSSSATTAAIGRISIREMIKRGYSPAFTCGVVMAGGTLGIMIPPSMPFVLYAIITECSIAKLFMAGILPGLLLSFLLCLFAWIRIKLNPDLVNYIKVNKNHTPTEEDAQAVIDEINGLKGSDSNSNGAGESGKVITEENTVHPLSIISAFVLILFVLGSIYTGICTPTEAAGVGVFGSFLVVLISKRLNSKTLIDILSQGAKTSVMILMLSICGMGLTYVVSYLGIASAISKSIAASGMSKWAVLALVYFMWLVLGCLMDPGSMVVLTIPFLLPTLNSLGFDTLWLGVVSTLLVEVGMITPPVGLNLFVTKSISDVPYSEIIKGALPYLGVFAVALIILTIFPQIALWLPGRM